MKKFILAVVGAAFTCCLIVSCGPGAGEKWQAAYDAGQKAFKQKNFAVAESLFAEAMILAETFAEDDSRFALTLEKLAESRASSGMYDEARETFGRLASLREKTPDADQLELADLYHRMGVLADWKSEWDVSQGFHQKALDIYEKYLEPADMRIHHSLNRLAWAARITGFYERSESLYVRMMENREPPDNEYDEGYIGDLIHLGEIYIISGQYDKALPIYERVIKMREDEYGKNDPSVGAILEPYAGLLRELGRDFEADQIDTRIQQIRNP